MALLYLMCKPGLMWATVAPARRRSCTRAFHGTASPSEFATMLRVLGSLHSALGLQADLSAAAAAEAEATAMEADDGAAEGPVGPDSSGGGDGLAEPQGWRRQPPVLIPGVESALLRQLLAAAGDLGVAAAAREWLGRIDEEAAAANDMLKLFRWVDWGRGRARLGRAGCICLGPCRSSEPCCQRCPASIGNPIATQWVSQHC